MKGNLGVKYSIFSVSCVVGADKGTRQNAWHSAGASRVYLLKAVLPNLAA